MAISLADKTVVVTGASRGIGLGIARAFANSGARLVLLADDPAVLAVAEELGGQGRVVDITDAAAVKAALQPVGRIDVLVNNAGLEAMTPVDSDNSDNERVVRRIVEVNVVGTFLVTGAALPAMRSGGRIINTASVWARGAEARFGAYVASKHAVIGLTKTWAKELGPRGITVNAVCPGWVRTEASMRSLHRIASADRRGEAEVMDDILDGQILPGLMEPDDVAGPYLFLASDLAANMTGQSVGVDRGEFPW
ncbi:MAG: SDR family oxidoreductase [Rhodospirillales bacterium]|nr:SDR family oxidoreductase [Rhodospirillales bacterium]